MTDNKTNKLLKKLDQTQNIINVFSLSILTFLVVLQIILRYVLKLPLLGIEELMIFPTIWLFVIGGASASLRNDHIECGMIDSFIKDPKKLDIINLLKHILSSVISAVLTIYTFQMALYSFNLWKTSGTLYIPMFFAEGSIFLGMLLMFFYSLFHLSEFILIIKYGRDNK